MATSIAPSAGPVAVPTPYPETLGFACEDQEIGGLAFLGAGWHDGVELKWGDTGCIGPYEIASPNLAVACSSALGWMHYALNDPADVQPNFGPDEDHEMHYRLWMTTLLWFTGEAGQPVFYQLDSWTYANLFTEKNLATGSFHWAHNDQWFDAGGNLAYDTFHPRLLDTRLVATTQIKAFAASYLLYWPNSSYNGAGSVGKLLSLKDVGFCGI